MEVNHYPRIHQKPLSADLVNVQDHKSRMVDRNSTHDIGKHLEPKISSLSTVSLNSSPRHKINTQHLHDKNKKKVKHLNQSYSVTHNLEKYAFHNEGFNDTIDGSRQSQPSNSFVKELYNNSLLEANDFSQDDHVTNKKREENNSEAHSTYPNYTLKFPFQAVNFKNICYDIPRRENLITNLMTCSKKRSVIPILKSINLDIPQGNIYGLLGPSSCGKTTLLRCLVGLLQPTSGTIRLFGHDLITNDHKGRKSQNCHVPGKNVGYMPQDLGLYEDFSIRQILTMFGRYMFMPANIILERIEFMTEFLDLPDKDRIVNTLSGGQKRRVSFAIACFHMPPLIILDEPTVGVDPLLRKAIWTFLRRLASHENKTILITTHYIEEAAQADLVALMRDGEIVMQDTPKNIMRAQSSLTLEEAFLKICSKRSNNYRNNPPNVESYSILSKNPLSSGSIIGIGGNDGDIATGCWFRGINYRRSYSFSPESNHGDRRELSLGNKKPRNSYKSHVDTISSCSYLSSSSIDEETLTNSPQINSSIKTNILGIDRSKEKSKTKLEKWILSLKRNIILFQALLYKNYKRNFNSIPLVIFQFMLPIIQMITFCLCIGGKPTNIGLGIVNMDNPSEFYTTSETGERLEPLGSVFLTYIDTSMLDLKPYSNLTEAISDVSQAKLWAVMEFGPNFTEAVTQRFSLPDLLETDAQTVNESLIRLHSDKTRRILDILCLRSIMESYKQFLNKEFLGFEQLPVEMGRPIFKIKPSLIGTSVDGYTESIAAGLMASLTYFMAAGLTTFIMVVERGEGILERTYTTGISPFTYLFAHAVFRSLVMMAQIAFLMALTFLVLDQPLVGSPVLLYLLLIMLNCTGIAFGLLISSLCQDQNGAALTIVSSLVVKLTLSGILWPLESIPNWLKLISAIQPLTMPVKALKSITLKGRDLSDKNVSLGFIVCLIWFVIFLAIASKKFKFYK